MVTGQDCKPSLSTISSSFIFCRFSLALRWIFRRRIIQAILAYNYSKLCRFSQQSRKKAFLGCNQPIMAPFGWPKLTRLAVSVSQSAQPLHSSRTECFFFTPNQYQHLATIQPIIFFSYNKLAPDTDSRTEYLWLPEQ